MTSLRVSVMWRFGVCVFIVLSLLVMNLVGVYLFATPQMPNANIQTRLMLGSQDGIITALSIMFTAGVLSLMCWGIIYQKTRSIAQTKDFFNLGKFNIKDLGRYVGIMIIIVAISELLMIYFDSTPMTFLDDIMTAASFWWLIIAIVVIAPIYEEVVFRGLIFGIIHQDGTPTKSIIISSLLFAVVHLQYDMIGMMSIFMLGVLFCHARLKHGLGLAMLLHFLNNTVAMVSYFLLS